MNPAQLTGDLDTRPGNFDFDAADEYLSTSFDFSAGADGDWELDIVCPFEKITGSTKTKGDRPEIFLLAWIKTFTK